MDSIYGSRYTELEETMGFVLGEIERIREIISAIGRTKQTGYFRLYLYCATVLMRSLSNQTGTKDICKVLK